VRLGGLGKQEEVPSIYTITSVLCTMCWSVSFSSQRSADNNVRACVYIQLLYNRMWITVYIYTSTMQEVRLISFFSFTSLLCIFSDDSFLSALICFCTHQRNGRRACN
jgi:hypothetical protein